MKNKTPIKIPINSITVEKLKSMYYTIVKIRRFEEKLIKLYPSQELKTPVHLCIGEEAIATGVCANLKKEDYIFSTHRSHGHCIAKGSNIKHFMAEMYGKITGCSKGKGGSMHLVDPENGNFGSSAIVGGSIPLAVGAALASMMRKDGKVSVAFFGDGAVDEGVFHESLNFASLKKLPVVFICENNFYATNSPASARQAFKIYKLAKGYNIQGRLIDGNDLLDVYTESKEAIEIARNEGGPTLLECTTYRWKAHVGPNCDYETGCRPKEELYQWMKKCPVKDYENLLLNRKIISKSYIIDIINLIDKELDDAVLFAKNSLFPEPTKILEDVY